MNDDAELLPCPAVGQVWRPERGGMWRTIIAIQPAGVEWTAAPNAHEFSRFDGWNKWVRDARASPAVAP
jgi:hypothetical protein